jgi:hypothetical protein
MKKVDKDVVRQMIFPVILLLSSIGVFLYVLLSR